MLASPIKSKLAGSFKPKMTFKKRTYAETIDAYYVKSAIDKRVPISNDSLNHEIVSPTPNQGLIESLLVSKKTPTKRELIQIAS